MNNASNKNKVIEVLWNSDKDELFANKFTGAVRVMKTIKISQPGKKPSYKKILDRVEYYQNGVNQKNAICHRCAAYTNKFISSHAVCEICINEMYAKANR